MNLVGRKPEKQLLEREMCKLGGWFYAGFVRLRAALDCAVRWPTVGFDAVGRGVGWRVNRSGLAKTPAIECFAPQCYPL